MESRAGVRKDWTEARAWASSISSIFLGGAFGVIATIGMGAPIMAEFAFILGAMVGAMCFPALLFALRHGPWLLGLVLIAVPTAAAAYFGGRLTAPNGGPFLSMGIAVGVYLFASYIRGLAGLKWYPPPPPHACLQCGYDRRGLAPGAVCPECGTPPA